MPTTETTPSRGIGQKKGGTLAILPRSSKAVIHQKWICGQAWPSRGQMEKHLWLGNQGLARRSIYEAADGHTYRRVEQQPEAA